MNVVPALVALTALSPVLGTAPRLSPVGSPDVVLDVVLGVDLSYVNEVEDCGGTFHDAGHDADRGDGLDDPFEILAAHGANLVRARLWHTPDWTSYSTVEDVIRTFRRAEASGMRTLLDFHYSDEWADPSRQNPPAAWAAIPGTDELAAELGTYTVDVLEQLDAAGVLPDMVQVGNEINSGIVNQAAGVDWTHDGPLFEAGIEAVRSVAESSGHEIDVMLHVAQPENGLWWFEEAAAAGLTDFDVIGLSYYPQWSSFSIDELGSAVHSLASAYGKDVIVVETGYPWTLDAASESADNVLDQAVRAYPISPDGQAAFMRDLTSTVVANGGSGTVYWEPAWLSTPCRTRWGQGSHWENATLFDFDGELHAGAGYLSEPYDRPDAEPATATANTAGDREGDVTGAARNDGADLVELRAGAAGSVVHVTVTIAGDVREWPGSVLLAIDSASGGGDGGRRPYDFADDSRPELLVETTWHDEPGVGYATTTTSEWVDGAWHERPFTGSVTVTANPGGTTEVRWALPVGGRVQGGATLTAMTAARGRAGALVDVIDPGEPVDPVAISLGIGGDEA